VENQHHVELIKDNGTVVDAGANAGVFSVFAATKHPHATIYAFEPTPSTFEALKENTKHYPNIKVFNCGLGEKNEMSTIVSAAHSGGNYLGTGGFPIEVKTIDSLNIPMDFLKVDTEGYEANVLKGARETIKKHRPILALSAYHKPNDKKELPELVNSMAPYDCELLHGGDLICK
jgi:FkbM family methyltransferase